MSGWYHPTMPMRREGVNRKIRAASSLTNRGPAAAAEDRAAILSAARSVFAEQGYRIPFSTIARAAGVGQAVMYRHFPSKLHVALAVFEENIAELEHLARSPEPDAFWHVWDRLVAMTIESSAFVDMVIDAAVQLPDYTGTARVESLLGTALERAQSAGRAPAGLVGRGGLLTPRMVYGVVASGPTPGPTRESVSEALALVAWVADRPSDA